MTHELTTVTGGRYTVIESIGAGATARVDLVEDSADGTRWAAKAYRLDRVPDWKTWELVERGARVLAGLDNPGIPLLREVIRSEPPHPTALWVIEEHIPGGNFRTRIRAGESYSDHDIARITLSVWQTLDWLHLRRPPIIHRDVKPSNLMMRPDGSVVLIDFGAVAHALAEHTLGGSTVVGTFGYMPPEQFMGRAEPASDLYALGATLVFLLTGRDPSELAVRDMRLDIAPVTARHPRFAPILEALLEPRVEVRAATARATRSRLAAMVRGGDPAPTNEVQAALAALLAHEPRKHPAPQPDRNQPSVPRAVAVRIPDRGRSSTLACPSCKGAMRAVDMGDQGDVEVDVCLNCHGMWLDPGELDLLVGKGPVKRADPLEIRRQVNALAPPLGPIIYRQCPHCDAVMHRRNFARISGIVVDECSRHGLYLDSGELEAIRHFVALGGLTLASEEAAQQTRTTAAKSTAFSGQDRPGGLGGALADPDLTAHTGGVLGLFLRWLGR